MINMIRKGLVGLLGSGALALGMSREMKGDQFYINFMDGGVNRSSLEIDHTAGANEGYGFGDVTFLQAPTPALDIYSLTSIPGHEKLGLDARPPESYSTINSEIVGVGLSSSVNNHLGFTIEDALGENIFANKNIFADLYNSSHTLLGTYNVKDMAAAGTTIPITVNNGLSYTMDVRFTPLITSHTLQIDFQRSDHNGGWIGGVNKLVLSYGEDGAGSARNDSKDVNIGWGSARYGATSPGQFGILTTSGLFQGSSEFLTTDARALTDTSPVLVEAWSNKIEPYPSQWIPGVTWNEGGRINIKVLSTDKHYFDGFSSEFVEPSTFADHGLENKLLGSILDANGEGNIEFGRFGSEWFSLGSECDWWKGPFQGLILNPNGTDLNSPMPYDITIGAGEYAIVHIKTPEPSTISLLAMAGIAGAGVAAYSLRNRSRRKEEEKGAA